MKFHNPHTARHLEATVSLPPGHEPFASTNTGFHSTYARLVDQQLARLGKDLPVIVLLGDHATLLSGDTEQCEVFIPERYHELKALGHLVFGTQLALMANGEGSLAEVTERDLREKLGQIHELQAVLDSPAWSANESTVSSELLRQAGGLIGGVLEERRVEFARLREPIRALAPLCLEIARLAACLELGRLDGLVTSWREHLGESRWARLCVVICGGHQPRYREVTSQYFARLLGENQGFAAEQEDRILFGEGLADIDAALHLLARHLIDQEASQMLFGNRRRLQEDLLADAACAELKDLFQSRDL